MILFTLLPRLLRRSGARLILAFGSIMIGAMTLAVVLGLIGSVQRFFISESRTLLGGDITIGAGSPIDTTERTLSTLKADGATQSERIDTLAVLQSDGPKDEGRLSSLLVSLKVVDDAYPLYGSLKTKLPGVLKIGDDEIFVAEDILTRMGITTGDTLVLGEGRFRVTNIVTSEPDRVGGNFRLGPLAIISKEGWAKTGIDGKQSRVTHTLSVRFPDTFTEARAQVAVGAIREAFPRKDYRVSFAADGPSSLLRILDAAERFFFTMIVLTLFLVVVNIRLNLIYFLTSFQKTIAIMRSLGMRRRDLLVLFLVFLFVLSALAGVVGGIIGNLLANTALPFAERFIESPLPEVMLWNNIAIVVLFTVILCLFSALGFFVRVLAIEPKMLLLGYVSMHGKRPLLAKELPVLLLTLFGLYGGVYYLTLRPTVALIAVGSITISFVLLFMLARLGITLGHVARFAFPFSVRSIMNFLKHKGVLGTTTIASLTIALASIFSIALIEQNILGNLGAEFKKDAPNIYLIDVQDDQREGVRAMMGPTWRDFSTIRARFTMRDGYDIQANLDTEDAELRREFNVTSGTELLAGEELVDGVWHGSTGKMEVSVEQEFALRAKLVLGTRIQFTTLGVPLEATVTSIRKITTTNGLPFFFLTFSPDVLLGIPQSSFGYAFVEEGQIPLLQNQIAIAYPNISSIPTTQILETVGRVVGVLGVAVRATALPALLLGFMLIIAMIAIAARERVNDMLVFTVFGARIRLLFSIFMIESVAIVLISGIFAGILSHVGVYALNQFVFDFTKFYFASENGYIFLAVLVMTLVIAFVFARRFTTLTPDALLRKPG